MTDPDSNAVLTLLRELQYRIERPRRTGRAPTGAGGTTMGKENDVPRRTERQKKRRSQQRLARLRREPIHKPTTRKRSDRMPEQRPVNRCAVARCPAVGHWPAGDTCPTHRDPFAAPDHQTTTTTEGR